MSSLAVACGKKLEGSPVVSLWMVHVTGLVNKSKIQGLLGPRKECLHPLHAWLPPEVRGVVFFEVSLSLALRSRGYDERFEQIQVLQYRSLCDRWGESLWYLILRYYSLLVLRPAHVQLMEALPTSAVVSRQQMKAVCRYLPSSLSFLLDHISYNFKNNFCY